MWHMEVPILEVESELQPPAYTQPQLCQIQAVSATHTTAHRQCRISTHRARPGIEPSWEAGSFFLQLVAHVDFRASVSSSAAPRLGTFPSPHTNPLCLGLHGFSFGTDRFIGPLGAGR